MHRETTTRLMANVSSETMETVRQWYTIFQMMTGKCCHQNYYIQQNILQKGKIKTFTDSKK